MDPITVVEGPVSVLDRDDVDTDQIIPKQFLKRVERTGFGQYLFYDWRENEDWDLPSNPILATGRNFGCGSSREHAPWALEDFGFKAVIAPSFADIFYANSTKIGLLPIPVPVDAVRAIMAAGRARVDLEAQEVSWDGGSARFEIDPDTKHRLLNGLDEIGLTLQKEDAIAAYERDRERPGPVTTAL
jgi:3-isopropylmalate/(R)-2-methylmalate dehydratase small subunit